MFEDQSSVYIVTEYLRGADGLELLRGQKSISEETASLILHQVLLAIKYCHKRRVMHRYSCHNPATSSSRTSSSMPRPAASS